MKPAYGQPIDSITYGKTLAFFETLLKLLHPFMPFITEELWQHIYDRKLGESIMCSPLNALQAEASDAQDALLKRFEEFKEIVSGIRTIRQQKNLAQKEQLELQIVSSKGLAGEGWGEALAKLCNLSGIKAVETKSEGAAAFMVGTTEYAVPLGNLINVEEELKKAGSRPEIPGRILAERAEKARQREVREQGSPQTSSKWNARSRLTQKQRSPH